MTYKTFPTLQKTVLDKNIIKDETLLNIVHPIEMVTFDVYLLEKLNNKEIDQEQGADLLKKYKRLSSQEAFKDKAIANELLQELNDLLNKNKNKNT